MNLQGTEETTSVLPNVANTGTFLRSPRRELSDVPPGSLAVVGIPTDSTAASRPGARWGPSAIRSASAELDYFIRSSMDRELVDIETGVGFRYADTIETLVDCGDLMTFPLDPQRTVDVVSKAIADLAAAGTVPVGLGGDHFVTFPLCKGVADGLGRRNNEVRIGLVQLDADLDLSADNPTWGPLFHGTNARRIADLPQFDPANIVMFGTSGFTRRDQWDFAREAGITIIPASEIRRTGARQAMERGLEIALRDVDALYITCDIDVIDGAFAPGTGGLTMDGLLPSELFEAAEVLSAAENVVGIDVVEVSPNLDSSGRTPHIASDFITGVLDRRLFTRVPPAG